MAYGAAPTAPVSNVVSSYYYSMAFVLFLILILLLLGTPI